MKGRESLARLLAVKHLGASLRRARQRQVNGQEERWRKVECIR